VKASSSAKNRKKTPKKGKTLRKRNLLCLKNKESLDLGHKLLYEPYKNILANFVELSLNPKTKDFDPVSRVFDGLESISEDLKHYYEALLGVTSYYQHSQGGRGKYVEKRFSSLVQTCSLNIKLSELPLWLQYPELHRRKGILTLKGLTSEEKSQIRRIEWDFIGKVDETTDLGNLIKDEKTIVLLELKNRVDSGGTAARREIWTKKFKSLLEILNTDEPKLYKKNNEEFSLIELLRYFGIEKLEIYIGILFDVAGNPATKEGDKGQGFYSSNEEGYRDLKNTIDRKELTIVKEDSKTLKRILDINGFEVTFGSLYGDEIPHRLFRKPYSVSDLLILKYDDIWLAQLTSISERTFLLKFGKNFMTILKDCLRKDRDVRQLYDDFITAEGSEASQNALIEYLLTNYSTEFLPKFYPSEKQKSEYLTDVIQVLAASEA